MQRRAEEVVQLLKTLRELSLDDDASFGPGAGAGASSSSLPTLPSAGKQHHMDVSPARAPKRPWEDVSAAEDEDEYGPGVALGGSGAGLGLGAGGTGAAGLSAALIPGSERAQTAAEEDMALIRRKRATNQALQGGPGTPKNKYRKRSRATPPGKCHSCNITETPEWRRGPDGARTLCNACGLREFSSLFLWLLRFALLIMDSTFFLDYAKMLKKRDKHPGEHIEIDMDTLRASTRAAAEREQRKAERERERDQLVAQKNGSTLGIGNAGVENGNPNPAGDANNTSPRSVHSHISPPGSGVGTGTGPTAYSPGAYSVEPQVPVTAGLSVPDIPPPASARSEPMAMQGWSNTERYHHHYGSGGGEQQHSYARGPGPGSGLAHVRTATS